MTICFKKWKLPKGTLVRCDSLILGTKEHITPGRLGLVLKHEKPLVMTILWLSLGDIGDCVVNYHPDACQTIRCDLQGFTVQFSVVRLPRGSEKQEWQKVWEREEWLSDTVIKKAKRAWKRRNS